jgi:anti-sigma factor RsiW
MSARPYITCRELIDLIAAYLEHELPPQVDADLRRHLLICVSCVAYLATYEKTILACKATARYDEAVAEAAPEELVKVILRIAR